MASLKSKRSLSALGRNIKQARLARRFSIAELAIRADISERTLIRLEKGDGGVGIGNLASVLGALGQLDALADLLSPENDAVGLSRALQGVPKRGRSFKPAAPADPAGAPEKGQELDDKPGRSRGVSF